MRELPKIRKKREQKYTPKILAWVKENIKQSCAIEIKVSETDTLPPSAVKAHQTYNLLLAKLSTLQVKLKDSGSRQVFDAFQLHHALAIIVIYFIRRKTLLVLDAQDFRGATYNQHKYLYRVENF